MDMLEQLLRFAESDANRWEDAANDCEEIARPLSKTYQAQCHLLACVYRDRAQAHREIVASIRQRMNGSSSRT
jgi:hypothetical protein